MINEQNLPNDTVDIPLTTIDQVQLRSSEFVNPQLINNHWTNVRFTIGFSIHLLIVMIISLVFGLPTLNTSIKSNSFDQLLEENWLLLNIKSIISCLIIASIICILISFLFLIIFYVCSNRIVKLCFVLNLIIKSLICIIGLIYSRWQFSIIIAVFLLLTIFYFMTVRKRIEFAERHLQIGCESLKSNLSIIIIVLFVLFLQFFWFILWLMMILSIYHLRNPLAMSNNEIRVNSSERINETDRLIKFISSTETSMKRSNNTGELIRYYAIEAGQLYLNILITFFLLYSFYWITTTFRNLLNFVTSCTVVHWWFINDINQDYSFRNSLKRSFTTNFGTIAFGSLFLPIFQPLSCCIKHEDDQQNDQSTEVTRRPKRFFSRIESWINCFNHWSFISCALTGQSFIDSSQSFVHLIKERRWKRIVHDDLIGYSLNILNITIGILTAIIATILFPLLTSNSASTDKFASDISIICFLIGISISSTITSIFTSSARTVLVCFAFNPLRLNENHPQSLQKLIQIWQKFHRKEFLMSNYQNKLAKSTTDEDISTNISL